MLPSIFPGAGHLSSNLDTYSPKINISEHLPAIYYLEDNQPQATFFFKGKENQVSIAPRSSEADHPAPEQFREVWPTVTAGSSCAFQTYHT